MRFFKEKTMRNRWLALSSILSLCSVTTVAHAWGDEGHEVVALIAKHYLDPAGCDQGQQYPGGRQARHLTPNSEYRHGGHLG